MVGPVCVIVAVVEISAVVLPVIRVTKDPAGIAEFPLTTEPTVRLSVVCPAPLIVILFEPLTVATLRTTSAGGPSYAVPSFSDDQPA